MSGPNVLTLDQGPSPLTGRAAPADTERTMPSGSSLKHARRQLAKAWQSYVLSDRNSRNEAPLPRGVRPEIVTSWGRSADQVPGEVDSAPLADPADTAAAWEATPLRTAVGRIEAELR